MNKMSTNILTSVYGELDRAIRKFPSWPNDPLHALAILGEEFGELTKDCLQLTYEPDKTTVENLKAEAIQTAAMALRFAASLDDYIFIKSEQHRQKEWAEGIEDYRNSGGTQPYYD